MKHNFVHNAYKMAIIGIHLMKSVKIHALNTKIKKCKNVIFVSNSDLVGIQYKIFVMMIVNLYRIMYMIQFYKYVKNNVKYLMKQQVNVYNV